MPLVYFYDYEANWGDSINKYIFKSILGREVLSANEIFNIKNQEIITGIGSVLNSRLDNYSVWGSGFLSDSHSLINRPNNVLAVRGEFTQRKIKKLFNINCETLGDPGLLFREFYNPKLSKQFSIGIIPHFKEISDPVIRNLQVRFGNDINIIDPRINIFKFADEVKKCESILSSSLHGLVLSESYGIPTSWIRISNKLIGGDFKFQDYYSGVGIKSNCNNFFILDEYKSFKKLIESTSQKDLIYNSSSLRNCLFNYWYGK